MPKQCAPWLLTMLVGCAHVLPPQPSQSSQAPSAPTVSVTPPSPEVRPDKTPGNPATDIPAYSLLKRADWQDLPNWRADNLLNSWPVWLKSCQALQKKTAWQAVCQQALQQDASDTSKLQAYWQTQFEVFQLRQATGESSGLITGYYQPVLRGATAPSSRYPVPLYQVPPDLIQVNLSVLYPELKYKRLRGRLQGQTLQPYFSRAEIDQRPSPLAGQELIWVDDAVDAFFLHVQGSGIVSLENGERVPIGYADQNGHPYQSIGKVLVDRGELRASEASMQGIKQWGQQHPEQLRALLNSNPSYVFFKRLPPGLSGPLGALGVPLTAARSIAIDPSMVPLGAPVYLATTYPNSEQTLQQLMFAQDTGGAIKGGVRADVYWGEGDAAGKLAGAMRQSGQMWVWLPKGFPLTAKVFSQ